MALAIKQTRVVEVPVTTLRACMDMACIATILDAEGVVVGQSSTPAWMPQVLQIDLESGRIVNWRAPSCEQLQAMAYSQEVIPTMPADLAAIARVQREDAEWADTAMDIDDWLNAPEPKRRCPISGQLIPFECASIEVMPESAAETIEPEHAAPAKHSPVSGFGPAQPRYRNPATGETWTGRGKQPMWVQEAIVTGAKLEDFLIDAHMPAAELA